MRVFSTAYFHSSFSKFSRAKTVECNFTVFIALDPYSSEILNAKYRKNRFTPAGERIQNAMPCFLTTVYIRIGYAVILDRIVPVN